ncbi:putative galactinol--sucrose galactosyltransferase 6 [Hibiscus syriacus]|uniref:Galactinol--sucrose galactosyltransferase 6 n=1 Tax=Hibiscus syriacus TaxID=106335 RepID=A0A6A2YAF9_HIBSY|nr:putative galactinol--sucrose galactosyltransferase 6 [Hibiscus syriacus]
MTIKPAVRIAERKLVVKNRTILTGVPENVMATSGTGSGPVEGVFLGAVFDEENSRHVVPIGTLRDVRFMSCFRFKLWWMAQKMGDQGKDIPMETQFLLVETKEGSHLDSAGENQIVYTVFLPLIEGPFRAVLQGNQNDELEMCLESGDAETQSVVDVTQEGVEAGLESLASGRTPAKFVIIDDGWQSVGGDTNREETPSSSVDQAETKQQPLLRLTGIKENEKFQKKDDPTVGIKNIVNIAKEKHGLKYVRLARDHGNEPGWKTDAIAVQGLGLVNPKKLHFGNPRRRSRWSGGVDEPISSGLDASVGRNFPDNGIIACMSQTLMHSTDGGRKSIRRFYPWDPVSHTIHIAAVAYNSVFLGEFMLPDWDMFHSLHPSAEYHASARAISGGPIYVSLLKIWNMNKYTGVLGVYNCQGAAWNRVARKNTFHQTNTDSISGHVKGRDVHLISEASLDPEWTGDCAVYSHQTGELITLPYNASMPVSLKVLEHEIFTLTPIKHLAPGFSFAPLGLIGMYNSGGAIEDLKYEVKDGAKLSELDTRYEGESSGLIGARVENSINEMVGKVCMEIKGCGNFGAYSQPAKKVHSWI